MSNVDKHAFVTDSIGTKYFLYNWRVTEKGIEKVIDIDPDHRPTKIKHRPDAYQPITFVRGSKLAEEGVTAVDGILHEGLMSMMIADLEYKNGLVPSKNTEQVIKKLKECLDILGKRATSRKKAGVQNTYKEDKADKPVVKKVEKDN